MIDASRAPAGLSSFQHARTIDSSSPRRTSRPARSRDPRIILTFIIRPKSSADISFKLDGVLTVRTDEASHFRLESRQRNTIAPKCNSADRDNCDVGSE